MIQAYQRSRGFARATAILLVAAISMGTVLPLVWCFGGSDHSAIEFKVGNTASKSTDGGPDSHPVQNASVTADDKYHPADCVDRDVFPPAALTSEPDASVVDWIDVPVPLPVEARCIVRNETTARAAIGPRPLVANTFPALDELKTVVLLT